MADFLPVNARFFVDSLQGKTDKITEKDFSPEEIQTLREIGNNKFRPVVPMFNASSQELAAIQKDLHSPQVGYPDYSPNPDQRNAAWATLTDPRYRIATSLGNFGMKDEGDHYKVYDKYNWNGDFKEPVKSLKDLWNNPNVDKTSLTSVGNALAEIYAPKTSRSVELRVPKKAPPKEPDVIDQIFSNPVDLVRSMFTRK